MRCIKVRSHPTAAHRQIRAGLGVKIRSTAHLLKKRNFEFMKFSTLLNKRFQDKREQYTIAFSQKTSPQALCTCVPGLYATDPQHLVADGDGLVITRWLQQS